MRTPVRAAVVLITTCAAAPWLAGCARRPLPAHPSERALFKDLERQVTVAAATGWRIDRLEVESLMQGALDSACRVDALDRRALLAWLDAEIARAGGPVEDAWRQRGKRLAAIEDLLVLTRIRLVLARAEALSLDCPFWVEPERPFRGRQISEDRWQVSLGGGGKGLLVLQGDAEDVSFGGAGRLLIGRMFGSGDGLYVGAELGASAWFPKDDTGTRSSLQLGGDLVVPIVYRHTLTNAYVEVEGGWLAQATEQDWSAVDHGLHVGIAIGARALRTRFLFPGGALGIAYERTWVDGEDLQTLKVGGRVMFDLDL